MELQNENVRMEVQKRNLGLWRFFGRFFSVSKEVLGCAKKASNVSTGVPWVWKFYSHLELSVGKKLRRFVRRFRCAWWRQSKTLEDDILGLSSVSPDQLGFGWLENHQILTPEWLRGSKSFYRNSQGFFSTCSIYCPLKLVGVCLENPRTYSRAPLYRLGLPPRSNNQHLSERRMFTACLLHENQRKFLLSPGCHA